MSTIPLSKGYIAVVDKDLLSHLNKYKWFVTTTNKADRFYAATTVNGKKVRMHRLIWEIKNGAIPPSREIDHISRDRLDNRIFNLRLATRSENNINAKVRSDNTTGYKGVYYIKGRKKPYWAHVRKDGKRYGLGMYKTAKEASVAYKNKASELYGEFA
jgi:hypothetical protein